jgi:hypothetical protein
LDVETVEEGVTDVAELGATALLLGFVWVEDIAVELMAATLVEAGKDDFALDA